MPGEADTALKRCWVGVLDREVLSTIPDSTRLSVLRDSNVYVRPRPGYEFHIRWRSPDHDDIRLPPGGRGPRECETESKCEKRA